MTVPPTDHPVRRTVVLDGHVDDRRALGGKGAALDRLVAWGLPVPATGALKADVTRELAATSPVREVLDDLRAGRPVTAGEVDEVFLRVALPVGLEDEIAALARTVGAGSRLAIRSSATAEDLAHTSFAGQYRSILDVDPADRLAVVHAVRLVLASLWHPAPFAYRRAMGVADDDIAMCVLLMRMIPASLAGVVFTVAPEDPGAARVEFVHGLADDLVGGRVTPEARTIGRADVARAVGGADPVDDVASAAVALALTVEQHDGRPQDVEWAWDGERVWLVQARPITTLHVSVDEFDATPDQLDALDLTTIGIGETLPGVLGPLLWDINRHLVEEAFRTLFDRLGALDDGIDANHAFVWRVNGRAAMDFGRLARASGVLPGANTDQLEAQYFGSRRTGHRAAASTRRRRDWVRATVHDLRVSSVRGRSIIDADVVSHVAGTLETNAARDEIALLDDRALVARHLHVLDLATRAMTAELSVAAHAVATYRRLEQLLGRRFDAEQAGRLAGVLTSAASVAVAPSPTASAAVFAGPTWAEVTAQRTAAPPPLGAGADAEPGDEVRRALGAAEQRDQLRTRLWLRAVRRCTTEATDQLRRRERTKAAVLRLGGAARSIHLEMGTRLVGRGVLAAPTDVELLTVAELHGALLDGPPLAADLLRTRRRHLRNHQEESPLPARFRGVPQRQAVAPQLTDRLEGWAAARGRYTGRVRVVSDPSGPFVDGEVLVATATDPSWSPLFARAGAIVLERGGPLSHAAILARELGVPAVLNVPHATTHLEGQVVLVDGDAGEVAIVAAPADGAGADGAAGAAASPDGTAGAAGRAGDETP